MHAPRASDRGPWALVDDVRPLGHGPWIRVFVTRTLELGPQGEAQLQPLKTQTKLAVANSAVASTKGSEQAAGGGFRGDGGGSRSVGKVLKG